MLDSISDRNFPDNKTGVSEVIATIAMVGLVVVLAAAVSALVFGINVPLFNPEIVYVDASKADLAGTDYIVVTHRCGESVELMSPGGCIIKIIDPSSAIITPANADGGPINWDDGVPVYIYRTAGGYEISASQPPGPIVAFDPGTWGIVGVDAKNNIVMFQDSVEF